MSDSVDYHTIYTHRAREYDAMVAAEDVDGNLPRTLAALARFDGARVLEIGCGTGHITRILLGQGARVFGFDRSPGMLAVARERLAGEPPRWTLARADARALPVAAGWADLAIEGWAIGHLLDEDPAWRDSVKRALAEMERALRPGGRFVLIESLGFGVTEPGPPHADLAEFYAWLERERGMTRHAIRTDFQFPDVESAARGTGFFFGPELERRIRERGWARVPECTGIWTGIRDGASVRGPARPDGP